MDIRSNYRPSPPDISHLSCKNCGASTLPYDNSLGHTIFACVRCGKTAKIFTLDMSDLMAEKDRESLRYFWALCAMAALFQKRANWPDWVTPQCPRIRTPEYRDRFSVSLPFDPYPVDMAWNAEIPASMEINEITVHMNTFTIAVNASTALDGRYEVGLGFLFLGTDPDFNREGHGVIYCWYDRREL